MTFRPRGTSEARPASPALCSLIVLLALVGVWSGCADDGSSGHSDPRDVDAGPAAQPPTVAVCPPDNPYCKRAPEAVAAPSCGSQPIDLAPVGVNVMIAIEGAATMTNHWPQVRSAVESLRKSHPDTAFGLHIFWGELVENLESGLAKNNWCGATHERVLEVGDHDARELTEFVGQAPPGPAFLGGLFATSPVIEPLNYYLRHASKLADPTRTNYLLFVTGGNDNCFGSVFTSNMDRLLAYQKLAVELGKVDIRVIPVGFDAENGGASGSGFFNTTPSNTNLEALTTLLRHGGSGLTEVPRVDDPRQFAEVVAQVGQTVRNCRFAIPDALDPARALNPFELGFAINGVEVKRDRMRAEGWNFIDGDTSQVELFGRACQAVRAKAPLEAKKSCAENVCGSAAIEVATKPRAVLHLLDASASRISCTDDSFGCLSVPDSAGRSALSYWEVVEHALGKSLVAPINDDIEFGLQLFPAKSAGGFSCDVAAAPEIAPAQGTEISIMSNMLEKLPFGFSPVVQVLESVAAQPGRLADPDVEGAVVLLTDGGDNCADAPQPEVLARLATAARTLRDAGVATYVVRFGSPSGKSPEQESQLRTIVANGGTARSDPTDPTLTPYIDAVDESALNDALHSISTALATCTFEIGALPAMADVDAANVYINGELVPYDGRREKAQGWGWLDAKKRAIEMYGDACTGFKNNRKTSVIVEFGCEVVTVI